MCYKKTLSMDIGKWNSLDTNRLEAYQRFEKTVLSKKPQACVKSLNLLVKP